MKFFKRNQIAKSVSGPLLVADFKTAVANLTTMHTAQFLAKQSEQAVLGVIGEAARMVTTPNGQNNVVNQETIQQSLDAHVKKVQAEQIASVALRDTTEHELIDSQQYKGKKVIVTAIHGFDTPFEAAWLNEQTGEYKVNSYRTKSIRGTIDDLSLSKNIIVIKPTFLSLTLTPARKYFLVHVIDIHSLEPAVSIDLL